MKVLTYFKRLDDDCINNKDQGWELEQLRGNLINLPLHWNITRGDYGSVEVEDTYLGKQICL